MGTIVMACGMCQFAEPTKDPPWVLCRWGPLNLLKDQRKDWCWQYAERVKPKEATDGH